MLKIPEVGFDKSKTESNVNCNVSADWIEASILFDDPQMTRGDFVDLLLEEQICEAGNQDLAHQITDEAWQELERRRQWGGLPETVQLTSDKIVGLDGWQHDVVRSFFVLLAIQRIFPDWAGEWCAYVTQGNLFEKVVERICPAFFPGWKTYRAGWSPENTKVVREIVDDLRDRINVTGAMDLDRWVGPYDKDGGLDVVCYRDFHDERDGLPLYFLQCASGKNWRTKIRTPDADLWYKWLNSAVRPSTGIVAPFVIDDWELRRAALKGQIVVFDRIRAVGAAREKGVVIEPELRDEVIGWMTPRVNDLPRGD